MSPKKYISLKGEEMTITEAMKQFATHQTAEGRSPKTIECYQRELRKLSHFLGPEALVEDIDNNRLNKFLTSDVSKYRPDGKERSLTSIANTKAIINAFCKWLAAAGHRSNNPAITTRVPRVKPKMPVYLSSDEVKALLKIIKETHGWRAFRDYTACVVILYTGIRISELIGLDINDFDQRNKNLHIKKAKGGQPETKHINGKLMKTLETYIKERLRFPTSRDCPALFISQWRQRLGKEQFTNRLKQWAKKAGIEKPVTPHTLRHTFATALYAKTKDIIAVQKALGHAYLSATEIYTHIDDQDLRNALDMLDQAF